ncbi:carboxypeptidase-like regulatory domain-containing protein, partial [candidate division KSB1 bacterium]
MRKLLSALASIFLILHSLSSQTFSQTVIPRTAVITGTVTDASTGEPLTGANVYIANSLMGAASDQNGSFIIHNTPFGTYQLVASYIGYKPEKILISVESNTTDNVDFRLTPVVLRLEEVVVTYERPKDWEKDLKTFQSGLLGSTDNADKCTILNPEVLNFERDDDNNVFRAVADRILKIENRALGYMVNVLLEEFEIRDETVKMNYTIKFEEIVPENDKEAENWEKARDETYNGSLQHFLTAFAQGTYGKEGFDVGFITIEKSRIVTEINYDAIILNGKNQYERIMHFDGLLRVRNLKAGMNRYPTTIRGRDAFAEIFKEESYIRLMRNRVPLNINGTLPEPYLILVIGYWGKARIADKLPFEYKPDLK